MFSFLLLCAVGMSALCLLLREQILCWLNTPAEALAYAREYATTCMLGLVFIYGYNTVSAILRGMGDPKRPFLFIALAAVVNLVLDLWFIAGLNLGAFGAALATVIGQGLSFLLAIAYLYRKRALFGFDFRLRSFAIDRYMVVSLVKLGVPMAIKSASIQFSKLFVNAWINSYGVVVSAVTGVAHKINSISNLFANSVNTAGSSMVGQNIGAQKYGRVSRIIGVAFAINGVCSSLLALCMLVFPRQVFGLFTSDAEVLEVCMQFIPVALVIFAGSALRSPMNAFINGCGNYRLNFAVALLDGIVARISLALLLGLVGGLDTWAFGTATPWPASRPLSSAPSTTCPASGSAARPSSSRTEKASLPRRRPNSLFPLFPHGRAPSKRMGRALLPAKRPAPHPRSVWVGQSFPVARRLARIDKAHAVTI